MNLRNTIVFIFGAPQIGTLLIQDNQQVAIDLPSKLLIWKDSEENIMISRNLTSWLKKRHNLKEDKAIAVLEEKIKIIVEEVIS